MRHAWWNLPGPTAFLDGVESELVSGRHVIVVVPATLDYTSLEAAIMRRIKRADLRYARWQPEDVVGEDGLFASLARAASVAVPAGRPTTAADIAAAPSFSSQVVVVAAKSQEIQLQWCDALAALAVASRASEERGLVCLILAGVPKSALPAEDITLAVRPWWDATDRLDMSLWAATLLRGQVRSPHQRRLGVAFVTEVAGADPWLAERLVASRVEGLEDGVRVLASYAEEMQWSPETELVWHRGSLEHIDGQPLPHSAALAARRDSREIGRRVWAAQVGIAFPQLELERVRILNQHRSLLRVPFDTPWGSVEDAESLELGHLRSQLVGRVPGASIRRLDELVRVRNCLAHLEVVDPPLLERLFAGATS